MPYGLPRRARAGVAAGLTLALLGLASSPALADQARQNEWWLHTLHVTGAWQSTRGSGITIAVLDTGVDTAQADLTGAVITGPDYTNSGRTFHGPFWGIHGTEVASLIAGHGHGTGQAGGILGVAPSAKILSVRVTLEGNDPLLTNQAIADGLPGAIARGIRYAVRHGASVIDLPLDPVTTAGAAGSGGSPAERAAVGYALDRNVVLVAPAGDGGAGSNPVNYPAAYRGVISVGAFDQHFVKAPFTSRQKYVTVTAAGAAVTAASPSGSYPQINSTSAASAIVAGIAALIRAQFPVLTPAEVTRALTTSTVFRPRGGRSDGSGFGTVDAARALMAAAAIAETVPSGGGASAAQAPPSAPAVHSSPIHRNIRHTLIRDAVIAGAVFVLLLALILGVGTWRRRRARSARLAEVRAATRVPARKGKGKGKGKGPAKPGPAKKQVPVPAGAAGADGEALVAATVPPQVEPAGFIPAPLTPVGSGQAMSGFAAGSPPGFPAPSGLGMRGRLGGSGLGTPGSFGTPAALGTSDSPGTPGGLGRPGGLSATGGLSSTGGLSAIGGLGLSGPPAAGAASPGTGSAPPWAPIPAEPRAAPRDGAGAAIPDSAFPGVPAAAPADDAGSGAQPASGGPALSRIAARRAQGTSRPAAPRTPSVSGRPPWEPAPEPDSELPWTQAPVPPRGGAGLLPRREPTRPELPAWDALAQEVWPGGPQAARRFPAVPHAQEEDTSPTGRSAGLMPGTGSAPASGLLPTPRPVPAAGPVPITGPEPAPALIPPRDDSSPPAGRPGNRWNPGAGVEPFRAAWTEPGAMPGGPVPGPGSSGASAGSLPGPAGSLAGPARSLPGPALGGPLPGASPVDPASGGSGAGFSGAGLSGAGLSGAGVPGAGRPQAGPPFPPASRPTTEPAVPGTGPQPAAAPFPRAARAESPRVTGTPPWEFTDSFLAVPRAEPGASVPGDASQGALRPGNPLSGGEGTATGAEPGGTAAVADDAAAGDAAPGESTPGLPGVEALPKRRAFPSAASGGGATSFPAIRPLADPDAFRLFPPGGKHDSGRGTPPAAED